MCVFTFWQEGVHTLRPVLSQHDLNFTVRDKLFVVTRLNTSQQIGNPLNSGTNENGIWPPPTDSTNQSVPPVPYPFLLATESSTPVAVNPRTLSSTDIVDTLPTKRTKGSWMRPTKTTTARYVYCHWTNCVPGNFQLIYFSIQEPLRAGMG